MISELVTHEGSAAIAGVVSVHHHQGVRADHVTAGDGGRLLRRLHLGLELRYLLLHLPHSLGQLLLKLLCLRQLLLSLGFFSGILQIYDAVGHTTLKSGSYIDRDEEREEDSEDEEVGEPHAD